MSIEYTYEVVAVDQTARCMEIVYASAGRQPMRVGARLPLAGEPLEAVVKMYSPVAYWLEQSAEVAVPQVGAAGTVAVADPTPVDLVAECKFAAKARLADTDWSQTADVAAVLTNKAEFDAYRAAIRAIFFAPVAAPAWPALPSAVWAAS